MGKTSSPLGASPIRSPLQLVNSKLTRGSASTASFSAVHRLHVGHSAECLGTSNQVHRFQGRADLVQTAFQEWRSVQLISRGPSNSELTLDEGSNCRIYPEIPINTTDSGRLMPSVCAVPLLRILSKCRPAYVLTQLVAVFVFALFHSTLARGF